MEIGRENKETVILSSASCENVSSAEERDRVLKFYHALLFSSVLPPETSTFIDETQTMKEITTALLGLREVLQMARKGDFSYKIQFKGFMGGALKALQANLSHVAWLTRRVADGDLSQRMDFMGDFSDSFNSMVEQLSTTLDALRHKQESLTALTEELQQEVEARKHTEQRLRVEKERWKLAVQCSRDGIWEINLKNQTLPYYSQRLAELTKFRLEDIPGVHDWPKLFHPDDQEILQLYRSFFLDENPPGYFELDHKLLCADGVYRWFQTRGMVLKDLITQEPTRIIGVTADIQDRKEREEFFSHRATHDALTELPNRIFFDEHLKNSIEYAKRNGTHLAVIMVDLDKFKSVNDTLGHLAGDTLLVEVAQRLQKNLRESDMVSRFGGDEFAMILAFGKDEWQSITKLLTRTMASLKKPMILKDKEITISASFGISICPDDGDHPQQLMMRADEALYYAKATGRNACAFWKTNKRYHVIRFESGMLKKHDLTSS